MHLDGVHAFARSLTGDEVLAEDLTQETYLRAWRSWHQYAPGTDCRAWLFTICRHLRGRQAEREQRVAYADTDELDSLASAGLHASLAESDRDGAFLDMPEFSDALRRGLDALPGEYREAVILVDVHDHTYAAAAGILGVPVGTVRSRLYRGRRLLQEALLAFARDAGLAAPERERG